MSIKVMTRVWENSKNKGSGLLLLLAIADHAHDDGAGAWPSIKTLAAKTRMSERNVQYLIRSVEKTGELKILTGEGPHGCNAYAIDLPPAQGENFAPLKNGAAGVKSSAAGVKSSVISSGARGFTRTKNRNKPVRENHYRGHPSNAPKNGKSRKTNIQGSFAQMVLNARTKP